MGFQKSAAVALFDGNSAAGSVDTRVSIVPWNRNRLLAAWVLLGLYVAVGTILLMYHEPWRDEADAWLIARDAPLSGWMMLLARTGQPVLWDLIVLPFARTGFPYSTEGTLHLLIACGSAAIVLFRAPFPMWQRALIIFSYYMSYEYLAIARNYALTILLLFALAAVYRNRDRRPVTFALLFALLVNSSVHALLIGAFIGPVFAWHFIARRIPRAWLAIGLMAAGGVVAGVPLALARGTMTVRPFGSESLRRGPFDTTALAFTPLFRDSLMRGGLFAGTIVIPVVIIITASVLIHRDRAALAVLWLSWAALLFVAACVRWGGLRHSGLLLIALIFSLWIADPVSGSHRVRALFTATLLLSLLWSLVFAVRVWRVEVLYPYSDSRNAAVYLLAHHLERWPMAAAVKAESILPYLPPRQVWYPQEAKDGTYLDWKASVLSAAETHLNVPATLAHFRDVPKFLVVSVEPIALRPEYRLRLLYATTGFVFGNYNGDEKYWVYARDSDK